MLTAVPNTGLWRRLEKEGRLHADQRMVSFTAGKAGETFPFALNFDTARPRRDILADFKEIYERIYNPEAFFGRIGKVNEILRRSQPKGKWETRMVLTRLWQILRVTWIVTAQRPEFRWIAWKNFIRCTYRNPRNLAEVVSLSLMYLHIGQFSSDVVRNIEREIALIDAGQVDPGRTAVREVVPPPAATVARERAELVH
jgi:hypothetical protein